MTAYENDSESMQDVSRIGVKRAVEAAMNVTRKTVKDAAQAQRNILHRGGDVFTAQCTLREALLAQSMANQAKSALEFDDAYALAAAEEALREAFEVRASMPCLPLPPVAEAPVEQPVAEMPVDVPVEAPIQVEVPMSQSSYTQASVEVQVPVDAPIEVPVELPVEAPVEVPVEESAAPYAPRTAGRHAATTCVDAEPVAAPTRSAQTRAARVRAARMQTAPVRDSVTHAAPAIFEADPAYQACETKDESIGNSDALFKKHRRDKSFTIPFGPLSEDMPEDAAESLFSGVCGVQPFEAEEPIARGNHQRVTAATLIGHAFDISEATHHTSEIQPLYTASTVPATVQPERPAAQSEVSVAAQVECAVAEIPRRTAAQHAASSTSSTSTGQHAAVSLFAHKVDRAPAYDVENTAAAQVSERTPSKPAPAPVRPASPQRVVPTTAKARKKAEKKAAKMVISKKITAEEAPDMVKKLLAEETSVPADTARTPQKPHVVRRVCIALGLVVVLAAGLGLAAYFGLISLPWGLQQRVEMLPEVNAKTGSLNVKPATVAPGDYRLVLNQTPRVAAGSLECPIQFENPEGNQYNSRLVLVLADGGEQIASTHRLSPNSYVDSITLSRALEPGTYKATAVVSVLAGTTQINSMSASVTITVK